MAAKDASRQLTEAEANQACAQLSNMLEQLRLAVEKSDLDGANQMYFRFMDRLKSLGFHNYDVDRPCGLPPQKEIFTKLLAEANSYKKEIEHLAKIDHV